MSKCIKNWCTIANTFQHGKLRTTGHEWRELLAAKITLNYNGTCRRSVQLVKLTNRCALSNWRLHQKHRASLTCEIVRRTDDYITFLMIQLRGNELSIIFIITSITYIFNTLFFLFTTSSIQYIQIVESYSVYYQDEGLDQFVHFQLLRRC